MQPIKPSEAPAFDRSSTRPESNPFEDLAASLVGYDTVDLLSAVAALQFLPQNASRVTRLEAFAHSVASLPLTVGPQISASRFRRTCVHRSLEELAYAEDPAENLFAEEFTFFGGPYLVLPGIAQAGEFMLSNLGIEGAIYDAMTDPKVTHIRVYPVSDMWACCAKQLTPEELNGAHELYLEEVATSEAETRALRKELLGPHGLKLVAAAQNGNNDRQTAKTEICKALGLWRPYSQNTSWAVVKRTIAESVASA